MVRPQILVPLIVAFGLFMENLDATILSTALPAIARDLHESPIQLKLALTSYLLTLAIFIPASGWFADRFGSRLIFRLAILVFAGGSVLCGFAGSVQMLVLARALQGVGGAMMVPVGRLVILRSIPKSELVGAMAWLTVPALTGPVLGPPIGGFITTYASWRWIFWINLPFALLGLVLATLFIPDVQAERVEPFDYVGFALSGLGLASIVSAAACFDSTFIPANLVAGLWVTGVAAICAYVWYARRVDAPILDLRLLRHATFRAGVIGGTLFRIGVGASPLLLPLLFQLGFGLNPLQSGLLTFVTALGAVGMKVFAGNILRRFGFRPVLVVNAALSSLLIAAPAFFRIDSPLALILGVLFVAGFFRSLQFTCINAISFAEVEHGWMSRATSFTSVFQQVSLSLGVTIGAAALQLAVGFRHGQALRAADFFPAFILVGAISFLSTVSFSRLPSDAGEEMAGRGVPEPVQPPAA